MELSVRPGNIATITADAIIVNLFEGITEPGGSTGAVNEATNGLLANHLKNQEFTGKELETLVLHSPTGINARHVIVVGLGQAIEFSPVTIRKAAAASIQKARELKAKTVATVVHGAGIAGIDPMVAGQMVAEGLLLGHYQFLRYKTLDKEKLTDQQMRMAMIVEEDETSLKKIEQGVIKGEAIATDILNSRDIINEPPSKIKPSHLAKAAEEIAALSRHISVTLLDEAKLKKEGYSALLAVAAGSEEKPYLVHLHYKPVKAPKTVAIVGKGVTFDSGGLGIKPWAAMQSMKTDMAGAANVLGIFQALAELEAANIPLNVEVHGVIVTTENMISGKAMRPDDIIETKSGKTVEILHTDAEGRLILSDGLTYATQFKPDYMIDYATLTGAAIKALGRSYGAYMGNNQDLLDLIQQASQETGEQAWPLPLPKEYRKYIESPVADLQNISNSALAPDAIIGGLFLQEFVNDIPWVHFDIAGPSFQEEDSNPVYPKGATGYGILLGLKLLEYLELVKD